MARLIIKDGHKRSHVLCRDWTMCSKYSNDSRFKLNIEIERANAIMLKRKKDFHFDFLYNFYIPTLI